MTVENIKKYMKINKISQLRLSELSGIPIGTIRDIFRGATRNPRIDTMNAIEEALGLKEKAEGNPQHNDIDQIMKKVQTLSNDQLKELLIIIEHFIKAIQK